jgi:Ca2+-binding RTX toxin-like protein
VDERLAFGNTFLGSIHGYKFNDENSNGQDDSEPRLSGVLITLVGDTDGDGTVDTLTTNTDGSGEYAFLGLYPGQYQVTETPPAGWTPTTATTVTVTIISGEEAVAYAGQAGNLLPGQFETVDVRLAFGNRTGGSITGRKFQDLDYSGDDNSGTDPGLGGVTIQLFQDDGDGIPELGGDDPLVDQTVTEPLTGHYSFDGLDGTYYVREVRPTGSVQSYGGNNGNDFYTFVVGVTTQITGADFGNYFCTQHRHEVSDGQYTFTAQNAGILTIELFHQDNPFDLLPDPPTFGGTFVVSDAGGTVTVFRNDGAGNIVTSPDGQSAPSIFDPNVQRVDILVTTPGTVYTIDVSNVPLGTFSILRTVNSVNVDIAASLALQITGTACDQLIAVHDDDPNPDPNVNPGGPSDAKRIFIGFVSSVFHYDDLNDDQDHAFVGVQYNAKIIDAVFGFPTISRVEIDARAGNDFVRVGNEIGQQSLIYGGPGDDAIRAGSGKSTMFGDAGNDVLIGGRADDVIFGGKGNDEIFGGAGSDRAFGDDGDDWIAGERDDDPLLRGGNGNDTISGGQGRDRLLGDSGSDTAYRDAVDLLVTGFSSVLYTPPDPVEDRLLGRIRDIFDDQDDADDDTIDEIIGALLPLWHPSYQP